MIEREEQRWQQIEQAQEYDREKWDAIRSEGSRNRRNVNSVPYNPISLQYSDSTDGDKLRLSDDMIRYRSAVRAKQLHDRNNCGFNPITGSPLQGIDLPTKPQRPEDLKG